MDCVARVVPLMQCKADLVLKMFPTHGAGQRLLPHVALLVGDQVDLLLEALAAHGAAVRPVLRVDSPVVVVGSFGGEALPTDGTLSGPTGWSIFRRSLLGGGICRSAAAGQCWIEAGGYGKCGMEAEVSG